MLPCKQKRLLLFHLQCDKLWQTQAMAKIISDPFAAYFGKHLHGMDVFLKPQSQQLQGKRWSAIREQHPSWFPIVHEQAEISRAWRTFQFSNESIPAIESWSNPQLYRRGGFFWKFSDVFCMTQSQFEWHWMCWKERISATLVYSMSCSPPYVHMTSLEVQHLPFAVRALGQCFILCKSIFGSYFFLSVLYMLLRFLIVFHTVTCIFWIRDKILI